ncbi:MAG: hypothetical protein AAFW64_07280 [Pseudomonadota bacterium]
MQKTLIAALIVGAAYLAWSAYGGAPGLSMPSSGSGGAGFSGFSNAAGNVAAGAKAAVR